MNVWEDSERDNQGFSGPVIEELCRDDSSFIRGVLEYVSGLVDLSFLCYLTRDVSSQLAARKANYIDTTIDYLSDTWIKNMLVDLVFLMSTFSKVHAIIIDVLGLALCEKYT